MSGRHFSIQFTWELVPETITKEYNKSLTFSTVAL